MSVTACRLLQLICSTEFSSKPLSTLQQRKTSYFLYLPLMKCNADIQKKCIIKFWFEATKKASGWWWWCRGQNSMHSDFFSGTRPCLWNLSLRNLFFSSMRFLDICPRCCSLDAQLLRRRTVDSRKCPSHHKLLDEKCIFAAAASLMMMIPPTFFEGKKWPVCWKFGSIF